MQPLVELEGDPPLTVLPLVTTIEGQVRRLLVYRDHDVPGALRLTEEVISSHSMRHYERVDNHTFSISHDIAVPLYTLKHESQQEWAMQVNCHGRPLILSFADRQEVLTLQRVLTGYGVTDSFFGVETLLGLKSHWKKLKFHSKTEHHGMAELQLWEWPDESLATTQVPQANTQSSQLQTPPASIAPSERSMSDAVTVQTDRSTGRQAIVTEVTPPPLLVMFLREPKHYTMIRIDAMNINTSTVPQLGGWLDVGTRLGVSIHTASMAADGLRSWNLCSMAAVNILDADTRKSESLHIKFHGTTETRRFEQALKDCRHRQATREEDRAAARNAALSQIVRAATVLTRPYEFQLPVSPRSSGLIHQPPVRHSQTYAIPQPQSQPPVTEPEAPFTPQGYGAQYTNAYGPPVTAVPARMYHPARSLSETFTASPAPMMTSALYEADVSQLSRPLARHQSLPEGADADYVWELETERRTGEVHGDSMPLQELSESSYRRWGVRHERDGSGRLPDDTVTEARRYPHRNSRIANQKTGDEVADKRTTSFYDAQWQGRR